MTAEAPTRNLDFIREIVEEDLRSGKYKSVVTRFPPEPNGYLHIGHAKSICLNFGIANEYGGHCNLRFDDTNPTKEEAEYAEAIKRDVNWLGFSWGDHLYHASDYFEQLYLWAEDLVRDGKAYVDSLTAEEIREHRGSLTEPGRESPYRNRTADENLDLFRRMRAGEFPDGAHVLRAKIDMQSPNINMRDPVLYRIRHEDHHRTGDRWDIYPMYDYAHPLSDAIERITHSICTLEFEAHRPLYDWLIENVRGAGHAASVRVRPPERQLHGDAKRKLLRLVEDRYVSGWDDPRMPTIAGLRRRGCTPAAIRNFAERVGVAKRENVIDVGLLEFCVREDLNRIAPRVMGVLRPLRVVIENYPEGQSEEFETPNNPEDAVRWHAQGAVFARPLHRARRLHGGAAEEVLPPGAGTRGAAAVCVLHHLHRRGEGRGREHRRAALLRTIRPRAAATRRTAEGRRRRCTGSPRRTPSTARCASTTGCSTSRIREAGGDFLDSPESSFAGGRARGEARAGHSRRLARSIASSSSASATSPSISTRRRTSSSSTAPSP